MSDDVNPAKDLAHLLPYPAAQRCGVQFDKPGKPGGALAPTVTQEPRLKERVPGNIEHAVGRESA